MFPESLERDDLERSLMRGRKDDIGRRTVHVRPQPIGCGHAPPIAGNESREPILRHRRDQVVADALLVLEKLAGDNSTDRVAPQVLGTGVAAPITKETGDRITAAGGERSAQDIEVGHGPSIAQVSGPSSAARSLARPALAAGEMPSIALLAAITGQALTELGPVPECHRAGLGLGREPAFACADLAQARLMALLLGEPALDVPLSHDVPTRSARRARTDCPPNLGRPPSGGPDGSPHRRARSHAATPPRGRPPRSTAVNACRRVPYPARAPRVPRRRVPSASPHLHRLIDRRARHPGLRSRSDARDRDRRPGTR